MTDKAVATIIITAGHSTNRSFLARSFGNMLVQLGFEVDLSHVGQHDIEPPSMDVVEKIEVVDGTLGTKYLMSEHRIGAPIQLDNQRNKPQAFVRPAVPQLLERHEVSVAVLGGPNIGKSTLLYMFGDFLKSREVDQERIKYTTLGEDYFAEWPAEALLDNMRQIKAKTKVVIYTRRSYGSESMAMLMATTDGHQPEQAAE